MFTATTARFVVAAIAASFVAVPVWAATARCGGSALCSSSVVNGDSPAQGLLDTISGLQQRSSRSYSEGQPIACFNNICAYYSNTHGRTFTADRSPRPWASDRGHGLQHLRRGRIRRLYGKRTDAIHLRLLGWRWLLRQQLRCLICFGAAPTSLPGDGHTYSPSLFVRVSGRCSAQTRWTVVTLTSSTPECPSRNPASLAILEKNVRLLRSWPSEISFRVNRRPSGASAGSSSPAA